MNSENIQHSLGARAAQFAAVEGALFDVLIVGGGIVGSGIARDAAMRGLRVCLVEQHDFAFGTSSRSSRLLHGGMRYLAQGRIGLVRDASVEKKIIHQIAPHLAEALPFVFPAYADNKNWLLWKLKIGVKIYDLLCGGHNLGKSSWLGKSETLEKVPGLRQEGLAGAVRYYDGFTNDARLVLDTLRSAAKQGATLFNYCRFKDAARKGTHVDPVLVSSLSSPGGGEGRGEEALGFPAQNPSPQPSPRLGGERELSTAPKYVARKEHWECEVMDELSGETHRLQAQAVVNATGPWADGLRHSRVKLRNTKGVHVVVERTRVPVPDTVVMTEGKRILFAIPWGERTILGTTDTDYHGSPDVVAVETEDIRYVLQIVNRFFPSAKLGERDVISSWAGVRPLIADPHGGPSDISRAHHIINPEPGWWDVAGGKLTTYRLMAEQAVDRIVKALSQANILNREMTPCRTAMEPLLSPNECEGVSGILPPKFGRELVEYFCAKEWAVHLDDVMVRRSGWHYYFADAAEKAGQVAGWMGECLGWTETKREAEIEHYRAIACGKVAP